MSKHTPGPWAVDWYVCTADAEDAKEQQCEIGREFWRRPRAIGPIGIEHSHWGGLLLDVSQADARLIAAAPDLYEALRRLVDWLESHELDKHGCLYSPIESLPHWDDATDALAKVEN